MYEYMFSVIVPVYNEGKGLKKCVNSLIRQDYQDYEIILVDDGSRDCSVQICDAYAKKYDYISVVHKENGGGVDARRVGIELAKGKYIVFADGDDYVEKNYMEHLHQAVRHKADLYILNAWNLSFSTKNKWLQNKNMKEGYIKPEQAAEKILSSLGGYVWNKIYVADVIKRNHIAFSKKIMFGDDIYINLQYLRYVKRVWVQNTASYVYIWSSPTSVCFGKASIKRFAEMEVVYQEVVSYTRQMHIPDKAYKKFLSSYLGVMVKLIAMLLENNENEKEILTAMEKSSLVNALSDFRAKGLKYKVYVYLIKYRKLKLCKWICSFATCYKKVMRRGR